MQRNYCGEDLNIFSWPKQMFQQICPDTNFDLIFHGLCLNNCFSGGRWQLPDAYCRSTLSCGHPWPSAPRKLDGNAAVRIVADSCQRRCFLASKTY